MSCKVMEHIICSNLMRHRDESNILTDFQHGFCRKRSCKTQLVLTVAELSQALDQGKQVDCVLLDFTKAFDKVSAIQTLFAAAMAGVTGKNLRLLE